LRIITDFQQSRTILSRGAPGQEETPAWLLQRIKSSFGEELTPEQVVARIISDVRQRGDAALFDYGQRLDGVKLDKLEVEPDEITRAYAQVDDKLLGAMKVAAERIKRYHRSRKRKLELKDGLGKVVRPLNRVGLYAPGGTAVYPSTVLMTAIPARAAGVNDIILATPPRPGGELPPSTLVAADLAGVNRIFKMGGAQAIAAMALGTQSVPRVDKVCGPGNLFVMLAKKQLYGQVDIDGLAGPSEIVILADDSASPAICAADLIAQAEHDALAWSVLITNSLPLAQSVAKEVENQLATLERADIIRRCLDNSGWLMVVNEMDKAVELVNLFAPEHLSLAVKDASYFVDMIENAGAIFMGQASAQALGDYIAGPSHVLPTGGTARFSSPLGVEHFVKTSSLIALDDETVQCLVPQAVIMARAEGLTAHARALEMRLKKRGRRK
jgi:histidinol dehydrogenase